MLRISRGYSRLEKEDIDVCWTNLYLPHATLSLDDAAFATYDHRRYEVLVNASDVLNSIVSLISESFN
jgi:hypothetical protein